jgi:hypothetical protein
MSLFLACLHLFFDVLMPFASCPTTRLLPVSYPSVLLSHSYLLDVFITGSFLCVTQPVSPTSMHPGPWSVSCSMHQSHGLSPISMFPVYHLTAWHPLHKQPVPCPISGLCSRCHGPRRLSTPKCFKLSLQLQAAQPWAQSEGRSSNQRGQVAETAGETPARGGLQLGGGQREVQPPTFLLRQLPR